MSSHESTRISFSPQEGVDVRSRLLTGLRNYPATDEELERSLGLFIRGSLWARFLAVYEIYSRVVDLPGAIADVGTWRGQTAVLCENFRAVLEPLNFYRRIYCFDTFEGYEGFGVRDRPSEIHRDGTYAVGGHEYASFLNELLKMHERSNAMGHNSGKHRVLIGDCRETIAKLLKDNPNEFFALAFFDVNSVEPTSVAFELLWDRLVPGGIAAFWQLTQDKIPAEGTFYAQDVLPTISHRLEKSRFYPGLCFLTKPCVL